MWKIMKLFNGAFVAVFVFLSCGCGMSAVRKELKSTRADFEKLRREVRRTSANVEDVSNQVFILQDRVDSNRTELQRRPGSATAAHGAASAVEKSENSEGTKVSLKLEGSSKGSGGGDTKGKVGSKGSDEKTGSDRSREVATGEDPEDFEHYDTEPPRRLRVVKVRPDEGDDEFGEGRGTGDGGERRSIKLDERALGGSSTGDLPTNVPLRAPDRIPVAPVPSRSRSGLRSRSRGVPDAKPIRAYRRAYALYLEGKYTEAQKMFESFARSYPKHDYADNAVFWRGQCQYQRKQYKAAVSSFREVLRRYPRGNKAADALLKLGMSYWKQGQNQQAKSLMVQVVEIYPNSRVAKLAGGVLEKLR